MNEQDKDKRIAQLEDQVRRLNGEIFEFISVQKVLVAAGLVSEDKIEKALDIVRDLKEST